jgi:molybdopterin biosynthesis enzyme
VLVLEPGDIHEDEAGLRLAELVAGEGLRVRGPNESRVDLLADVGGVLHIRTDLLERLNRIDPLEVFTAFDGSVVSEGALVASVKVAPHAVRQASIDAAERALGGRAVVRVAAFFARRVAVVVKESIHAPARDRFERSVRSKVESLGSSVVSIEYVEDEPTAVEVALARASRSADLVLTAGGGSTDPADPFFVALDRLGGRVVRRGVPAHPGSMLWLGRIGRAAVLGLPTCGAYSKATAADLLLPRLLSGEPASARTVAKLGHGGILTRDQRFRFPAYARELDAPEG